MSLTLDIVPKLQIVKALQAPTQNSRCGKHFWAFDCSTFTKQCLTVFLKGTADHLRACISMQPFCSVFTLATLLSSKTESFYLSFLPSLHLSSPKYPNTYPNWIIKSLKFSFGFKMTQRTSMPGVWDLEFLGAPLLQGTLSRFICCETQEGILTNHVLTRDTICPTEPNTDFKKEDKRMLISFWWVTVCLKWWLYTYVSVTAFHFFTTHFHHFTFYKANRHIFMQLVSGH